MEKLISKEVVDKDISGVTPVCCFHIVCLHLENI